MDRPRTLAKSLRRGSASTVLASVFLVATAFAQAAPSQSDVDVYKRRAAYLTQVGTNQYDRGFYDQAQKTYEGIAKFADRLDPVEQRKLQSLREKTARAVAEQRKAREAKLAAQDSLAKGDVAGARARLESLQNNAFLSEEDRLDITRSLRATARGGNVTPAVATSLGNGTDTSSVPASAADSAAQETDRLAALYYRSTLAYHSGDFKTAKEGFALMLKSEALPASIADKVRDNLAQIEAVEAVPEASAAKVTATTPLPATGVSVTPTAMPYRAPNEPAGAGSPSDAERIRALYDRSVELYSAGDLEGARRGFVEVSQSRLSTAPEGKRPEDYIAAIDRLLAASAVAPTPVAPQIPAQPAPVPLAVAEPTPALPGEPDAGDAGGFVGEINRRRSIIRSHTQAVVSNAVNQVQKYLAQGEFDQANDVVFNAQGVVNRYQMHLGEELYKQYTQQLDDANKSIADAQSLRDTQQVEKRRVDALQTEKDLREQADIDRKQRIDEHMERAKAYEKQQRYEAELGQLEAILAIDPLHNEALLMKQSVEDTIYLRKQLDLRRLSAKEHANTLLDTEEGAVPYSKEITYPKDWREILEKPTRRPDEPIQLDPANMIAYEQLDKVVDLSELTPEMPASQAIEIIRRKVEPPLNIVVLWREMLENAQIEPSTPINMDGPANAKLGTALENLLNALSNPAVGITIDYVINKGVITVGTQESLPQKKMETRVYDVSDLVGEPANYAQMGSMMGMMGMMGGMGGGMMGGMGGMGGGMMGGMGGMGGGYGGGMGGMGGGMMGGGMGMMGGGMGGMGGGMGMTGYMSGILAQSLRYLIENSIEPDSWFDLSDLGEGTIMVFPDQQPRKLAVYQTPEVHQQIRDLLDQLRKALGNEVSIEARFLAVTENFLEEMGLDFDFSYNLGGDWGVATVDQSSFLASRAAATGVSGSLGVSGVSDESGGIPPAANIRAGYGSVLDDLQVSLLVRATQARSDSKRLAAPKVTVLSGESAFFYLQDLITYALPPQTGQTNQNNLGGTTTTQGINAPQSVMQMPIGSNLTITPTITKDKKHVLLNIMTTQTDLLRFKQHTVQAPVAGSGTTTTGGTTNTPATVLTYQVEVPETETASVGTRVSVPDRGTLLLGGHKLSAAADKEAGVPILSKIPIVNLLFSNRSSIRDQKVLLILVKPTIILTDETDQEAVAAMEEIAEAGSGLSRR